MAISTEVYSSLKFLIMDISSWVRLALYEFAEVAANYNVGQTLLRHIDNALWIIEKSSQWALPPNTDEDKKTAISSELIRPLPWILFLPTLLFLRLLREAISFGALLMGEEPLRPSVIVKFLQNCRRSIRSIRYQGTRNMREKNNGDVAHKLKHNREGFSTWLSCAMSRMQSLMCYNAVRYTDPNTSQSSHNFSDTKLVIYKNTDPNPRKRQLSTDEEIIEDTDVYARENDLKNLVAKIQEFAETDSEDSDFSLKRDSDEYLDTSETTSEEDKVNSNVDPDSIHEEEESFVLSTEDERHNFSQPEVEQTISIIHNPAVESDHNIKEDLLISNGTPDKCKSKDTNELINTFLSEERSTSNNDESFEKSQLKIHQSPTKQTTKQAPSANHVNLPISKRKNKGVPRNMQLYSVKSKASKTKTTNKLSSSNSSEELSIRLENSDYLGSNDIVNSSSPIQV